MYTERFAVDGCMFSFLKSINDDYIRYERIIKSTIERYDLCLVFSLSLLYVFLQNAVHGLIRKGREDGTNVCREGESYHMDTVAPINTLSHL